LHGHGYLPESVHFPLATSAMTIRRNLRNRAAFHSNCEFETQGAVTAHYHRLTADEHLPGGISMEDAVSFAILLEEAGVDALHVSAGTYGSIEWVIPPSHMPQGCHAHLAALIKKAVKLPVISVGRINSPEIAEKILEDGCADFVSVGRGMIAIQTSEKRRRSGDKISAARLQRGIDTSFVMNHRMLINPEAPEETVAAQRRTRPLKASADCRRRPAE